MGLTLILAVTAAVAASMGYLAARRSDEGDEGDEEGERKAPPSSKAKSDAKKKPDPFEGLPLGLGDVVVTEREERWLAGALLMREGKQLIAALFFAPEGTKASAVAVFPPPRRDVYWMEPRELLPPDEPPATIEIDGIALRRRGRIPVTVERLGQGAPNAGEEAIFATYEAGGREVAALLTSQGQTLAWKGRRLDEGEYDRLGSG